MAELAMKTATSVFMIGLLVFAILSLIGMVYLTQMAFSDQKQVDGNYCGSLTKTERNIARLSMLVLWGQFVWIILGSFLKPVWMK